MDDQYYFENEDLTDEEYLDKVNERRDVLTMSRIEQAGTGHFTESIIPDHI